jgi:hypothetical protein
MYCNGYNNSNENDNWIVKGKNVVVVIIRSTFVFNIVIYSYLH